MSSRHNYARENTWEYWESLVRSCVVWRWKFTNRQLKLRANGRNIVGQQLPKLLDVTCCVRLHTLLHVVAQSLKPVKLFSQQLPTFLLFRDRRSVAQQCWIRLHSSSNSAGATHANYAWFTKTYGLYPSHDALQVPTLLGVVASICTPLPTRTQQLPTMAQQCWELLRPFARSLKQRRWLCHAHQPNVSPFPSQYALTLPNLSC